ncbi:MAG TPA: hypothetical protein VLK58_22395 [Conexibacter sp.]|nr:hypothetical protein [Conexibacter sp.]
MSKRWERLGVEALFVDHFADAAQLLHEIGLRRRSQESYEPIDARAARVIDGLERTVFEIGRSDDEFCRRQVALSRWLRTTLHDVMRATLGGSDPPADERFALTLWMLGRTGTTITGWAHSDRAHQDQTTIEALPISSASEWVAVQAVCQGVLVERDRSSPVSRWRYVRGLPVIFDSPTRLPIGCMTISSTKPGSESVLTALDASRTAVLHDGLLGAVYDVLSPISTLFQTARDVRHSR